MKFRNPKAELLAEGHPPKSESSKASTKVKKTEAKTVIKTSWEIVSVEIEAILDGILKDEANPKGLIHRHRVSVS